MSEDFNIVVTGASSGIGYELSKLYANSGMDVIGISRTIPSGIMFKDYIKTDLTKYDDVHNAVLCIREKYKKISILVHCAGIMQTGAASKLSIESIKNSYDVNVISPTYITSSLTKNLARSKGLVVFVGSVASDLNITGELIYSSTKAALKKNVENFAAENGRYGIKYLNIQPSICSSPMTQDLSTLGKDYMIKKSIINKALDCEDVANFIYEISESKQLHLMNGTSLYCGGIIR